MKRYQLFIGNEWLDPQSNDWFETLDPFSGEAWAQIPRANAADADRAVTAAKAALTGAWGAISATDRGMRLHRIGQLIDEHAASLAETEALDNGKLLSEVMGQVRYVAKYLYYYAGLADKVQGSVIPIQGDRIWISVDKWVGACRGAVGVMSAMGV